jgi:hypothetical protein
MMRTVKLAIASLTACVTIAAAAQADTGWHSEQPARPQPGIGAPVGLGRVGDITFWAPNRGMLITGGNDAVQPGLFAYDGSGWYRYSTVCGGANGRIAWAGPNEFWTISDQVKGQQVEASLNSGANRSLCHFLNGRVVASYAEPIGAKDAYLPMSAAACAGPSDCWFGGDRLPGDVNNGAFHLHWNGSELETMPSLSVTQPDLGDPGRAVRDIAVHQGRWYESVQVADDDKATDSEQADQPSLVHEIIDGSSNPFVPAGFSQPVDYGADVRPTQLAALDLTSDGNQLWGVAGPAVDGARAPILAFRLDGGGAFDQVELSATDSLVPGALVDNVAAEPGSDAVWVGYRVLDESKLARLTLLHQDGTTDSTVALPAAADGIGRKGDAGPIACPAAGQCWMATSTGWLFHRGGALPQDTDPMLHQLVTFRPPDGSIPPIPGDDLPDDVSGADLPPDQEPPLSEDGPGIAPTRSPRKKRKRPLVTGVRRPRILPRTTILVLSFKLTARARVQLVAKRKRAVVARSRRQVLAAGRHSVRVKLNAKRWPTSLRLNATAVASSASVASFNGAVSVVTVKAGAKR